MPVAVFLACRQCTSAGSRVSGKLIESIVVDKAYVPEIEQCCDLVQTHTVTHQENHVLDFLGLAVVQVSRLIDLDTFFQTEGIIAEAFEISGGLVEFLGDGHATVAFLELAYLEVLVVEISEIRCANLRMIGIEIVNAHIVEGVVRGRAFRSVPESDRLAHLVHLVYQCADDLGVLDDEAALAVPDGVRAEVRADYGHARKLFRRIIRVNDAVETDVFRIFAEIFRCRDIACNRDSYCCRIHGRVEDVRTAGKERDQCLHRRSCLGFEFHHELKRLSVRVRLAAVAVEHRHGRRVVQCFECHVLREVFHLMSHEQGSVFQEHVSLNGVHILCVCLPERDIACVVIVGMDKYRCLR